MVLLQVERRMGLFTSEIIGLTLEFPRNGYFVDLKKAVGSQVHLEMRH